MRTNRIKIDIMEHIKHYKIYQYADLNKGMQALRKILDQLKPFTELKGEKAKKIAVLL